MKVIKAALLLVTLCAVVGMAVVAVSCPPLAFFAVPASVMLLAVAVGV
jgi:hypothetical protein